MTFINDRKTLGRKKAKKVVKTRANRFKRAEGFGYSFDVLPKEGYSFDVLPKDGYSEVPNLPAPPENCTYVFDDMGNATLKCADAPIDAYLSTPTDTGVLPSSYASFQFPNWNTLTCEEISKYIAAIEQEMTYIRVTPDILAIYNKQLDYARTLLTEKCKKPVDLELGLGDTGGIKTPVEVPVDIADTPVDSELGTGIKEVIVPSPSVGTSSVAPVSAPTKAPIKFNLWWAVLAGVGLYLITKSNK